MANTTSTNSTVKGIEDRQLLGMGLYFLTCATAIYSTLIYVTTAVIIYKHLTLRGRRIIILNFICVFNIINNYAQVIMVFLTNSYPDMLVWIVGRHLNDGTFIVCILLYLLIMLKKPVGMLKESCTIYVTIAVIVISTFSIQVISCITGWERYFIAVLVTTTNVVTAFKTCYDDTSDVPRRISVTPSRKKTFLNKVLQLIAVVLAMSLSGIYLNYGVEEANHTKIRVEASIRCMYCIVKSFIYMSTMKDIPVFFRKDLANCKENLSIRYVSRKRRTCKVGISSPSTQHNVDFNNLYIGTNCANYSNFEGNLNDSARISVKPCYVVKSKI